MLEKFKEVYAFVKSESMGIYGGFKGEVEDNSEMISTFYHQLRYKLNIENREDIPTEEEMKKAIEQLKDIPKFTAIASTFLLPIPGATIGYIYLVRGIEKLTNNKIDLLPDNFKK